MIDIIASNCVEVSVPLVITRRGQGKTGFDIKVSEADPNKRFKNTFELFLTPSPDTIENSVDLWMIMRYDPDMGLDEPYELYPIVCNMDGNNYNVNKLKMLMKDVSSQVERLPKTKGGIVTITNGSPSMSMLFSTPVKSSLMDNQFKVLDHIEGIFQFCENEINDLKETIEELLARNVVYN